jgi:hypothetical protein
MDFRVSVTFMTHIKTRKLQRKLGPEAVLSLMHLFSHCASDRQDGNLSGMSVDDIELAAYWGGQPGVFVENLVDVGYLDQDGDGYRVHDWSDHNPYVATAENRRNAARKAAQARWQSEPDTEPEQEQSEPEYERNADACEPHTSRMPPAMPTTQHNSTQLDSTQHNTRGRIAQGNAPPGVGVSESEFLSVSTLQQRLGALNWPKWGKKWRKELQSRAPFDPLVANAAFTETKKMDRPNGGFFASTLVRYHDDPDSIPKPPPKHPASKPYVPPEGEPFEDETGAEQARRIAAMLDDIGEGMSAA